MCAGQTAPTEENARGTKRVKRAVRADVDLGNEVDEDIDFDQELQEVPLWSVPGRTALEKIGRIPITN